MNKLEKWWNRNTLHRRKEARLGGGMRGRRRLDRAEHCARHANGSF